MKVKDIMTWNVITVSSDAPIMETRKIMDTHKIRRLPVVDKGKLVGIVTLDRIESTGPSDATTLSIWEINYLLAKMKVKEIMQKDVVTIGPDASIEQALAKGQGLKVGIMPVVEDGKVIGVITTTDFMLKMLTPALGIGRPGTRLNISECNQPKNIRELMEIVEKSGMKVLSAHTMPPAEDTPNGFSLHVESENVKDLVKSIEAKGYKVVIVAR
ncbi:MAG: CBS domain-containing protein [Chloroflexi bacterium]|nr:CBS domain-containing protein [Chloroflexota bacterium]